MNVILLEKMGRLGGLGDQANVRPGYARNFLFPNGKAIPATADNVAKFEARRAELEKAAAGTLKEAQDRAAALLDKVITLTGRASEEGRLYGSFGTKDIADAVEKAGVALKKSEVLLPNGVLREIGEYDIGLHLHADVTVTIKVVVAAEQ